MTTTTRLETDFCIAGGGMAGVCAALAAARNGARVALIQDRSVLGGNASSEIRMHMVGASCSGRRPGARESGLIDEIRVDDAVRNPQRSPALFDLLLYDLVRREPNITLLLDTDCAACRTDRGRIVSVRALRPSTEEEFTVTAPFFADCTGDGRLGAEAGADFRMGREARAEYNESLAPEQADSRTLGSTILFMARRHERAMPFTAPPWARRFTEEDLRLRGHREYDYGYWWQEWGGELDAIKEAARLRDELLAIALGVWDHVKNGCSSPGDDVCDKWLAGAPAPVRETAANWALEWVGMLPGKRESRRFLGPHVLSEADVLEGRLPADMVAYGGWWIDLHPPAGVDAAAEYPCRQAEVPQLYGIPLRSLYSRNIENLFFAGRNVSATHVAFASTRVMATCAVMGQAVGTAAALACARGVRRAADVQPHIGRLQQTLLRQDAFLPGIANGDPDDLARCATARASSGEATAVLDGVTRHTSPRLHACLAEAGHQWVSGGLPAWIELSWPEPRRIAEVQLIFDTGFERELTLTMSERYHSRMIRGPQPETVCDYALTAGAWRCAVSGNYQRRRVHRPEQPVVADRLRLDIVSTHGDPHARVFEIRVY